MQSLYLLVFTRMRWWSHHEHLVLNQQRICFLNYPNQFEQIKQIVKSMKNEHCGENDKRKTSFQNSLMAKMCLATVTFFKKNTISRCIITYTRYLFTRNITCTWRPTILVLIYFVHQFVVSFFFIDSWYTIINSSLSTGVNNSFKRSWFPNC